jgi:hypothetical protein
MRRWLLDVTRRPVRIVAEVPGREEQVGPREGGSIKLSDDFGSARIARARRSDCQARRGDAHALIRRTDPVHRRRDAREV